MLMPLNQETNRHMGRCKKWVSASWNIAETSQESQYKLRPLRVMENYLPSNSVNWNVLVSEDDAWPDLHL